MSTLNSRLQLAILNRKKSKNLAEKGFTLIELLITVVILGTLSAIALPNFLNQSDQAKIQVANAEAQAAARACIQEQILEPSKTCTSFTSTTSGPTKKATATVSGQTITLVPAT